jgi:esterase/lipase superfamily enzyme
MVTEIREPGTTPSTHAALGLRGMKERGTRIPGKNAQVGFDTVPLFYLSKRDRTGNTAPANFYGGARGELELGVASVSIPSGHRKGRIERPNWLKLQVDDDPARFVTLLDVQPLEARPFCNRFSTVLTDAGTADVLVFVHGFFTSFADASRRCAQIAHDLEFPGVCALYSWASRGRPWPLSYTADEASIASAAIDLQKFLRILRTEVGARRVSLISHSMGARAVIELAVLLSRSPGSARYPEINQVVFAAPDEDATRFRDAVGLMTGLARRVTLYSSSHDCALWFSKFVHGGPRAGEAGERLVVVNGMDTIDASSIDTSLFGHSYFGDNRVLLTDIFSLLRDDVPPERRFGLVPRILAGERYWHFQP